MKKLITFILATALVSSLFLSCGKDKDDTPGSFTWTFNGTTHTADLNEAHVNFDLAPFMIRAIKGTNFNTSYTQLIYFSLSAFSPGTYTIAGSSGSNFGAYIDELGNGYTPYGTLTITSYSANRISGNFSCTITAPPNTYALTGSFSNVIVKQ